MFDFACSVYVFSLDFFVQVCLDAVRVCMEIARRLTSDRGKGGSALLVDYGDADVAKDTLRAFRNHKEVGVFDEPGTVSYRRAVTCDSLSRDHVHTFTRGVICDLLWRDYVHTFVRFQINLIGLLLT